MGDIVPDLYLLPEFVENPLIIRPREGREVTCVLNGHHAAWLHRSRPAEYELDHARTTRACADSVSYVDRVALFQSDDLVCVVALDVDDSLSTRFEVPDFPEVPDAKIRFDLRLHLERANRRGRGLSSRLRSGMSLH